MQREGTVRYVLAFDRRDDPIAGSAVKLRLVQQRGLNVRRPHVHRDRPQRLEMLDGRARVQRREEDRLRPISRR